jgi:hypothetical protein
MKINTLLTVNEFQVNSAGSAEQYMTKNTVLIAYRHPFVIRLKFTP